MTMWSSNLVLDPGLQYIKDNCVLMVQCSAFPTTYNQATVTYALADVAMTSADFTLADDVDGRKLTVAAKNGVTVDVPGTATYVALCSSNALLHVTEQEPKVLVDLSNISSWKINNKQPVAA